MLSRLTSQRVCTPHLEFLKEFVHIRSALSRRSLRYLQEKCEITKYPPFEKGSVPFPAFEKLIQFQEKVSTKK